MKVSNHMHSFFLLLCIILFVVGCGNQDYSVPDETIISVDLGDIYIGGSIFFGSYEQDGNTENGAEPIEWTILNMKDGQVLLFSRYGLDSPPFNEKDKRIRWDKCTLRKWLNETFMEKAFTDTEKNLILSTSLYTFPSRNL